MVNVNEVVRQLEANAEAIRALLRHVPSGQAQWKPDAETWSLAQVVEHFYNEERLDFRRHLREIFADPQLPWQSNRDGWTEMPSLDEALQGFLAERAESVAWLRSLSAPGWEARVSAPWGGSIRAGDVLFSWVEHDFLHIRQVNELLYSWNVEQAKPYSVEYAGEW